jgi:hypothetical protein
MTFAALWDLHATRTLRPMAAVEAKALVKRVTDDWLASNPGKTLVDFAALADVPYTGGLMRWRGRGNGPDAENLAKVLKAAGMFSEQPFSVALNLAGELVRRLEAGETLQAELLLQVADAAERAGEAAALFAARLRREAAVHN